MSAYRHAIASQVLGTFAIVLAIAANTALSPTAQAKSRTPAEATARAAAELTNAIAQGKITFTPTPTATATQIPTSTATPMLSDVPTALPTPPLSSSGDAQAVQVAQRWATRGFTTRYVRVNGINLHVAEAGDGDPVVLLHGYPQTGEIWRFVAPALARTHHVVIPDLRGMGLSEAAPTGYDLANVSEDIHQLSILMGLQTVKVVGHDWGASVAITYALRYRDEVTEAAFLESALPGEGFEDLWNFSTPNDNLAFIPFLLMGGSDSTDVTADLIKGREDVYLHHLWQSFTGDKLAAPFENWQPYVEAMARPGIVTSSSAYYRSAYISATEIRSLDTVKLSIPILSIAGEMGIGVHQEALVRTFATNVSATIVLPEAGHFVAEERPAEVSTALGSFLQDTTGNSGR